MNFVCDLLRRLEKRDLNNSYETRESVLNLNVISTLLDQLSLLSGALINIGDDPIHITYSFYRSVICDVVLW